MRNEITKAKTTSCCSPCRLQQSLENKNRCAVGNGSVAC